MERSLVSVLGVATVLGGFALSGCASSTTNSPAAAPVAARDLVVTAVAEQEDFAQHVGLRGPSLVLLGRDGVVRRVHSGYRGTEMDGAVGREVNALLAPGQHQDAIASTGAVP
jgi:hypothetical protein